jgi:hypothetical protein
VPKRALLALGFVGLVLLIYYGLGADAIFGRFVPKIVSKPARRLSDAIFASRSDPAGSLRRRAGFDTIFGTNRPKIASAVGYHFAIRSDGTPSV